MSQQVRDGGRVVNMAVVIAMALSGQDKRERTDILARRSDVRSRKPGYVGLEPR